MSTSTNLVGFALPEGNRLGPNCGVTAVGVVAGVTFARAWDACRALKGRRGNWKGRTFDEEREHALDLLGVTWERMADPRCTLATFARQTRLDDAKFMVCVRGHCMVISRGWVIDQFGVKSPLLHHKRRAIVRYALRCPAP